MTDTSPTDDRPDIRQAATILAIVVMVVFGSFAGTGFVAAQEDEDPVAQCSEGPPVPGQDPGDTDEVEVAMVNDRSNSMQTGTRFPDLKEATTGFVARLDDSHEVAEIWFDLSVSFENSLTTDHQSVIDSINSQTIGEFTEGFPDAIDTTHTELTEGENANAGAGKAMIVATDAETGGFDDTETLSEADEAKDDGIRIFVVGFGGDVDEQFAEDLASNPDDAYIDPGSGELDAIYQEISEEVEDVEPVEPANNLTIDTRSLFQPGETNGYTVTNETIHPDGSVSTTDVTDEASVNTSNTSLLTPDEQAAELTATNDANASAGVVITADHNDQQGCVNAIVGQASVENIEILPPEYRYTTTIDSGTFQAILIAVFAGIVGTRWSTAFGGLGMMQLVLVAGWFGGYVSTGIALVGLFTAMFIGLNLAANIDYTVRR